MDEADLAVRGIWAKRHYFDAEGRALFTADDIQVLHRGALEQSGALPLRSRRDGVFLSSSVALSVFGPDRDVKKQLRCADNFRRRSPFPAAVYCPAQSSAGRRVRPSPSLSPRRARERGTSGRSSGSAVA
jgi:hypothetical protein